MPASLATATANLLLQSLAPGDLALLAPHLARTPLPLRQALVRADQPITEVVFPEYGVVSVVSSTPNGEGIELGVFGRDGMSAPSLLLGVDRTPQDTFVQIEGAGLRMDASAFTSALGQSASLHASLLKYVQAMTIQIAHTAVAIRGYKLEARLARWLLMCHDRLDTDELQLTHAFMSDMLAVRRSGVTVALQTLSDAGMVRARRGSVRVLDRAKLKALAGGSYGPPEAEYERLIGPLRQARAGGLAPA